MANAMHNRTWGKVVAVVASVLFALGSVEWFLWSAFGPHRWEPRFACDRRVWRFEDVSQERILRKVFTIRNTGRRPLHISEVIPGCCACTTATLSQEHVAPGGSATLTAELDASQLSPGEKTVTILMRTNDPLHPDVVLYLKGIVVPAKEMGGQPEGAGESSSFSN
jgi:uncharacterized protein DUF1573